MHSQFEFSVDLFYSYSHRDKKYKEKMEESLSLLRDQDKILKTWSDNNILPGQNIPDKIEEKINSTNIIVFLVSQNFIASRECMKEWFRACEISQKNPSYVRIPIILSECAWKDMEGMSTLKALPIDANPIEKFDDIESAWQQIYQGIKDVIENLRRQFVIKELFREEMEKTEFLSQNRVKLSDIFIFPAMCSYATEEKNNDVEIEINNENDLLKNNYTLIHGERLSGKTALCRHLFCTLADAGKPVLYIDLGNIGKKANENIFNRAYVDQFEGDYILWKNQNNKIVIFDNLSRENIDHVILAMDLFDKIILTTASDIFYSYYKDDVRLSQFREIAIRPLTHSKQENLIRKRWKILNRNQSLVHGQIDEIENRVNAIILSDRIFPRYPFYILSILQTYEAYMQYDLSLTAYGHCYHAIIIAHLIKSGISKSDDEMGACLNFAEHFAFEIYQKKSTSQMNTHDQNNFKDNFIQRYKKRFVPLRQSTLHRLFNSQYNILSNIGEFTNPYMYYYFLGKYFAKNMKRDSAIYDIVQNMMDNSYLKFNSLILIFIIHHTDDNQIIDDILLRTMCTLDYLEPSILDKKEVDVFQEIVNTIPPQSLSNDSIDSQREKQRLARDQNDDYQHFDGSEISEVNDMYKIMKNNEILGQILRNKYGSLEQDKILEIIETIADGGLRLIRLMLINKDDLNALADYLSEKNPQFELYQIQKILRIIFFILTIIHIQKIVVALNKPDIASFVKDVVSQKNTPAYDLIGYFLRLDTMNRFSNDDKENIRKLIKKNNYPFFKKIISIRTKSYLNTHSVGAPLEQSICSLLDIKYRQRLKKLNSKSKK